MVNAVISINENGKVLSFNKAAETLFNYTGSEIIGKNVNRLMPEFYATKHDSYLKHYMQTGEAHVIGLGREVEGQRKNKDIFPMRLLVAELPKDEDGTQRFIGSCIDLTHSKQQEEQIRRTQKMDALGKLTGGIAHDYNNLLGIIHGYAELLNENLNKEPKLAKYSLDILRAAERGAQLTKKLLLFSRNKTSNTSIVNINNLIKEQQLMLEKTLTPRIKLTLDLSADLWPVELDAGDLEDTIINMSINAMHAIETEGELTIRSSNEQLSIMDAKAMNLNSGDYILLTVTDTGCGMSETTKEKLFDPFYSTKGEGGTGLGLSQVYGFMGRSGGAIKVYSELGHGSRFALYFPISNKANKEVKTSTLDNKSILKGHETLLVVDDEQAMVELAEEILTNQGYHVLTANDGDQALAVLEQKTVDLMITDVIMPNMDGYQLAALVQKHYPQTKIQIVSGFADDRHNGMTGDEMLNNILYKPYTSNTLLTHVRKLLGSVLN